MPKIKRIELVYEFVAQDSAGKRYRLQHLREIVDVATRDDPGAELPGLEQLKTLDGRSANRVAKGRYEIVGYPAIIVTSTDQRAP